MILKNRCFWKSLLFGLFLTSFVAFGAEKLTMVTEATFPPYEYRDGEKILGIDPEIVRMVAQRNGLELVIMDMNFDSVIAAVQTGKADVAASGITITEERKRMVNFTTPYVSARQVIIVPEDSPIKEVGQLKGRRIGAQHGTTGAQYVTDHIQEPERFANAALAVSALLAKKVDCVVLDDAPSKVFLTKHPTLKILPEPLTSEEYAFAISKSRPELLAMFNKTLAEMSADGSLQAILDKHLTKNEGGDAAEMLTVSAVAKDAGGWEKLKQEFHINFVQDDRYMYLVNGFGITLLVAFDAVILGILIGFIVAVIRSTADQTGRFKVLNMLCKVYLTVIRGTPVVVQLLIIYFVIFGSVDVSKLVVAILAFGLNSGAYVAEIIRSGIMSIDRGQLEAGRSLGLSYPKTMLLIILPQALKNVLPALGNEFIVLLKETSVCGFIALSDLTKGGDIIRSQTYNAFFPLIMVAAIYLAVVMLFSRFLAMIEERLKKNE